MPIYEFYCSDCHVLFSFLSRAVNTTKRPACPRCARPRLERKASLFAISKGRAENADDEFPDLDDSRMERAMEQMAREADGINEYDPRAMAGLMRKFYDGAGLELGPGMQEAIRRLEAGEDPDKIEAELGDSLEHEDPLLGSAGPRIKNLRRRMRPPAVDRTLYEL